MLNLPERTLRGREEPCLPVDPPRSGRWLVAAGRQAHHQLRAEEVRIGRILVVDGDGAAVRLDDLMDDRQPQP